MHLLVRISLLAVLALVPLSPARAEKLTIAAAADLKFAMAEVVDNFRANRPGDRIEVIYGSSGKFFTQIRNGAPFDLYFSADIAFPRELEKLGLAQGAAGNPSPRRREAPLRRQVSRLLRIARKTEGNRIE